MALVLELLLSGWRSPLRARRFAFPAGGDCRGWGLLAAAQRWCQGSCLPLIQRRASLLTSANVAPTDSRECSALCLSSETRDEAHPHKVSRSMIGERVPAWTALVFAQRRRKLEAYSPTDSVSPCWRLKNAPARVEESRCSPPMLLQDGEDFARGVDFVCPHGQHFLLGPDPSRSPGGGCRICHGP